VSLRYTEITRTGEKTLLLKAQTGNILSPETSREDFKPNFVYFYDEFNSLFRAEDLPFQAGERVELTGMSVKIVGVGEEGAADAGFIPLCCFFRRPTSELAAMELEKGRFRFIFSVRSTGGRRKNLYRRAILEGLQLFDKACKEYSARLTGKNR